MPRRWPKGRLTTKSPAAGPPLIIEAEARRLERLVADLLELARLDAREFSSTPARSTSAKWPATPPSRLQPAAQEAGVRLVVGQVDGREPAAVAMADPERLAQVVANLVENALKYAATTVEVGTQTVSGGQDDRDRRRRRRPRHRPRRPAPGLRAALHLAPPARAGRSGPASAWPSSGNW